MSAGFVHLHCHSEYSVLDGASKVHELISRCKDYGMEACAITDHGNLFGALDFFSAARKSGVKPIIGCELYLAKGRRTEKTGRGGGSSHNHCLVLCESNEGYHNLCKLSSIGYLEGYHYKPRVDLEVLGKYKEGLICTSSCLAGVIPQYLIDDDRDSAEQALLDFLAIFGKEHFLIELMDHGLPEQEKVNPYLAEFAEKHGLMMIATNDSHYTDRSDSEAHDALLAIQTGATIDDEKRFKFPGGPQYYFASPDEMRQKFTRWPEAVDNTVKVAERCNVELETGQHLIPEFIPPDGFEKPAYLQHLVMEGLKERYGDPVGQTYVDRAEYEMSIIGQMGFVDYFLVVWDLIRFARESGIPVGPGRGSGAGSLVAYALEITNIDPIQYSLLFERFLNPERVSMPDFDLDFCERRRTAVIEYVRDKYGADNVSQIITFGRMKARQAVRDVGRVVGMSYGDVDRIAKLIPSEPKITLKDALGREPELKKIVNEEPQIKRLWDLAVRLEGTIRNCGTHAAGVIICDQPLTDHVGLFQAPGSDVVATQFEMKFAEEIGLLKMDFLGLRTLTVVHDAVRFIRENRGIEIDIDYLVPDDPKAYELLRSGRTMGVFQLESAGMRELSQRIGLESLEEICALVALYRPGPMALKDDYIENKHDPSRIQYDHPLLEPILKETYGIALYQEQVMQIVQACAGFSLGQADILRRAMGKKKVDLMMQQKEKFLEGCAANNIGSDTAEELFKKIETFAGYGFNKSHSMAYAFVAYQTAYLKANYPAEFMAALLTSESGNLDKVAQYVEECRRMGIEVLPPDVNHSFERFTVEGNAIRFGMNAVKNVGENAVNAVVEERKNGLYRDVFDLCARVDFHQINHRTLESLNRAGAFASTGWNRREVEESLEQATKEGQLDQKERESGQTSLFEMMADEGGVSGVVHERPNLEEWDEPELLQYEKEMLGLYVTSHPLAKHAETLDNFTDARIADIKEMKEGTEINIGGLVNTVKRYNTRRGDMAFLTLDTLEGPCEVTVFSDLFQQKREILQADRAVIVSARVNYRGEQVTLLANDVLNIEDAESSLTRAVHVRLPVGHTGKADLEKLAETLVADPGKCDVYLHCPTAENGEVVVHATSACRVQVSPDLRERVDAMLEGEGKVWFSCGNGLPRHDI